MQGRSLPILLLATAMAGGSVQAVNSGTSHHPVMRNDIEYSIQGGISLRMDAAIPDEANAAPGVIIVHGGGWVAGDRKIDVAPLFQPLSDAGFAWFSISYRLATNVSQFGVAIDDVECAVRFVRAHAEEFHVDRDRIALVGESAGGQLAAMAALRGSPVSAVVALYAPMDLVNLLKHSNYVPAQLRDQILGKPWQNFIFEALRRLSPIDNVRRDMPPFLLVHGTADPLVPFAQSTDFCDRMRAAGASCQLYPVDGAGHGIRWWENSPRVGNSYKRKIVDWLDQQLAKKRIQRVPGGGCSESADSGKVSACGTGPTG